MNSKALYVVAILVASVSSAYYYFSGSSEKLNTQVNQNMMYAATGVKALQTNEQGELFLRATIDNLQQDLKTQQSRMNHVNATMYQQGQVDASFYAKTVNGYDDNKKVVLSEQITITKSSPTGDMTFLTDELTLYPKQKLLETDRQVTVQSAQANFISQGVKADLNSGQYEFFNIRGQYAPQ